MERSLDILREKAFAYAEEAFEEHREQIFGAMYAMDLCSDMARQSGLLALDVLAELCAALGADETALREALAALHCEYDAGRNQFI